MYKKNIECIDLLDTCGPRLWTGSQFYKLQILDAKNVIYRTNDRSIENNSTGGWPMRNRSSMANTLRMRNRSELKIENSISRRRNIIQPVWNGDINAAKNTLCMLENLTEHKCFSRLRRINKSINCHRNIDQHLALAAVSERWHQGSCSGN